MTTDTLRSATASAPGELATTVRRAVEAIASGARASVEWRRLSRMTDGQLAREGLVRKDIARAVMDRHFR